MENRLALLDEIENRLAQDIRMKLNTDSRYPDSNSPREVEQVKLWAQLRLLHRIEDGTLQAVTKAHASLPRT